MKEPRNLEPIHETPEATGGVSERKNSDGEVPHKLTSNNGPVAHTPNTRGPVDPRDKPETNFNHPDDIGVDVI